MVLVGKKKNSHEVCVQVLRGRSCSLAVPKNIAMWPFSEPRWKVVSASKQRLREEEIQKVASVLPALRDDSNLDEQYTSASATQIVQNISKGIVFTCTIN